MKTIDIKSGANKWAEAAVDASVKTFYARQPGQDQGAESAPFPGRPALAIQLGAAGRLGEDKWRMAGPDSTKIEYLGLRTQTVLFRAFGSDTIKARDIVESLRQGVQKPTVRWVLRDNDLVVNSLEGAIDESAVRGAKWENRAQLDIEFRYRIRYTDEPGVIEKVPYSGTFEDAEGNTRTSSATHDRS